VPDAGHGAANEEVIDGKSEVGGYPVEKRPMRQWMLRITAYADRLLDDLALLDWPESLKEMQRNWIGKSVGAEVDFQVDPASLPVADRREASPLTPVAYLPSTVPMVPIGEEPDADDLDEAELITVFTTRPDTLYGATYMVLAPEHPLVDRLTTAEKRAAVDAYKASVATKSERDRLAEVKDKTGVFIGAYAINPMNGQRIPIYIADYVLMGYGTGAIMAVPAHDERDFEFAKKFNLPIVAVVMPPEVWLRQNAPRPDASAADYQRDPGSFKTAFTGEGVAINSPAIDGLPTERAKEKITDDLERDGIGKKSVKYKLRDWLFSRQRYWGEPFPILLDEQGNAYPVDEDELPVTLPDMDDFKPTGTGEPPLAKATDWLRVEIDGRVYQRETNTMPQWAGSCWYYLRYIDPKNAQRLVDPAKEEYWMPVDLYVGGAEHAVLHLLYARFWHKVLSDLGHVSTPEPFMKLVNQGLILGEMEFHTFHRPDGSHVSVTELEDIREEVIDGVAKMVASEKHTGEKVMGNRVDPDDVEKRGERFVIKNKPEIVVDARAFKMSKSRGNVVNPDEIVRDYGADCFRLYEMYMGPLEAQKPWNTRDIVGMSRFLNSVWRNIVGDEEKSSPVKRVGDLPIEGDIERMMHRTIKKVGEDIEGLRFNTAIAELIKLNNEMTGMRQVPRALAENFAMLLSPFAPHIAEELWERLGHRQSLARQPWPKFDPQKLAEANIEIPVQVNGKLRDRIMVSAEAQEQEVLAAAESSAKVRQWLEGKTIAKRIYVQKKLVSFVVK